MPTRKKLTPHRVIDRLRTVADRTAPSPCPSREWHAVIASLHHCGQLLTDQSSQAALGDLAVQVAHDLRGPVSFLRILLRHLRDQVTDAQLQHGMTTAESTLGKLHAMADDLCDVAKARHPHRTEVDLAQLAQSILQEVRGRSAQQIDLTYEGPEHLPAHLDALKLNRVLSNLLDNAVQAIAETQAGSVSLTLAPHHDNIVIEIRDTGVGISTEQQSHLFEKFFSTKGAKGNGLGLAYCKDVVEAHGGTIRIERTPGTGTTVHLALPRDDAPAQPLPTPTAATA
ncbi:MAG: HAMP domain-containing histidine kinase [Deltaproteobacteria bacterium]|nr:HAMP domain-containing histidine kinase [Deltaproteobacteria bacterium]